MQPSERVGEDRRDTREGAAGAGLSLGVCIHSRADSSMAPFSPTVSVCSLASWARDWLGDRVKSLVSWGFGFFGILSVGLPRTSHYLSP